MAVMPEQEIEANSQNRTSFGVVSETGGEVILQNPQRPSKVGFDTASYGQLGLRFTTVPLANAALILAASLEVEADPILGTSTATVNWKITGIDVDDSPIWSNNSRPGTGGTNFIIDSTNDVLVLTSDLGGPVSIDIPDNTYTGAALATALQAAMNADATLTGSGTITFVVSYTSTKFTLDATVGHTIAFTFAGSDAGLTVGFRADEAAAQAITSEFDVPGRPPETTAKVDWDRTGQTAGVRYTSPDLTSIVQEIVDRPGWVSNNDMSFVIRNDGATPTFMWLALRILDSGLYIPTFNCIYYSDITGQVMRMNILQGS